MRPNFLLRRAPLIAAAIMATGTLAACAHPVEYEDPVYTDRHRWDVREQRAYERWEAEQRYQHLEYERREAAEQRAYWTWRHNHPE